MTMLRVMILNYSNTTQTCVLEFAETISIWRCSRTQAATTPDEEIQARAESPWRLEVPAGEIYGFRLSDEFTSAGRPEITIVNPEPENIHIVTRSGKDPWPPPPPPPSTFSGDQEYSLRYASFLGGGSSGPKIPVLASFKLLAPSPAETKSP